MLVVLASGNVDVSRHYQLEMEDSPSGNAHELAIYRLMLPIAAGGVESGALR